MKGIAGRLGPEAFLIAVLGLSIPYNWARIWSYSGAAGLTYLLLAGESRDRRIFPTAPFPVLLIFINLACAAASTSWLFYWFFFGGCWSVVLLATLYQYPMVSDFARTRIRFLLRQLQFTADKVAIFDLPALEIDVDVAGLMVVRGVTLSLSTLTIVAHGIEVGIKLSDDMELAIQTDKVSIALFRRIDIDDVYANIKGGQFEMTFGKMEPSTTDSRGDALMDSDTPLLRAANSWSSQDAEKWQAPDKVKMTDKMTNDQSPSPTSFAHGVESTTTFAADDDEAALLYKNTLDAIERTSEINIARKNVNRMVIQKQETGTTQVNLNNARHVRASICSLLHDKPSIQHPPKESIKVTTLRNLTKPSVRRFLHRLPMLLRLLLNPLAYFHPINISSISAAASGRWIQSLVGAKVFAGYGEGNDIRKLRERIFGWLNDANFAVELGSFGATASVPFLTEYDINTRVLLGEIAAFRTLPREINLKEVVNIGGADATIMIPSLLLPHHEHLLPTRKEQAEEVRKQRIALERADSAPQVVQATHSLEQSKNDETNMKISAHISLPAVFDQELLNFVAALVKATKIIEFEKEGDIMDTEVHGFKEFGRALTSSMKEGIKRTTVNAAANDKWIAKLVGKVTKKLQSMQGDVGYSGNIPVSLAPYRATAEPEAKLLP